MQKINGFMANKIFIKDKREDKPSGDKPSSNKQDDQKCLGTEALSFQGKAFVNMQKTAKTPQTVEEARKMFLNALDKRIDNDTRKNDIKNLVKEDDKKQLEKLCFLTQLIENKSIREDEITNIFNSIQWNKDDELVEMQTELMNKLLCNDKLTLFDIKRMFKNLRWDRNDKFVKKQIGFTNELLKNEKFANYNVTYVFDKIKWDKDDEFIDSQINLFNQLVKSEKLTCYTASSIFDSIHWLEDNEYVKNQTNCLNELLSNNRFDGSAVNIIFGKLKWDEKGCPNKNQAEFLNELQEYKELNGSALARIFALIGWNQGDRIIQKQKGIVEEILKEHPKSDKIWPNFEEKVLLLENGFLSLNYPLIDYNKDSKAITEDVIASMHLESVSKDTREKMKSLMAKAMKNPRQFLDGIPTSHTEMETRVVNDKGKTKSFYKIDDKDIPEIIKDGYRKRIAAFFVSNKMSFARVCEYMDKDAIQTMMDKRLSKFQETISVLTDLTEENRDFIRALIEKNNKYKITINGEEQVKSLGGSGARKVELANMMLALQKLQDCENLSEKYNLVENNDNGKINLTKDGVVDFDKISSIISEGIMEKMELSKEEIKNLDASRKFNGKYMYCLADIEKDENIINLIRAASYGIFDSYIEDENNIYGRANHVTKEAFKEKQLDYSKWTSPGIEDVSFDLKNKNMTIRLWDRNPYEDLFVGNKTSCCTAIGDINGEFTPLYLLNKNFNVIEMYDDRGEVVGMSRVYMAEVEGKPSLIMDNIELNSNYGDGKTTEKERLKIRDNFFKYANEYAKQVTGNDDTQVYFSTKYAKVPKDNLPVHQYDVNLIGEIGGASTIYLNITGEEHPVNTHISAELYKVPKT